MEKIDPTSARWQELAGQLARNEVTILACKECGFPFIKGRCCPFCDSVDPEPEYPAFRGDGGDKT